MSRKERPGATDGEQFRIFIHVGSVRYGVNVRLKGNVFPNPATGSADRGRDGKPAGHIQLLQAPPQRRSERHADQPADLRAEHDQHGNDALVGQSRPEQPEELFNLTSPGWRRLSENAGGTPVRSGLHGEVRQHQGGAYSPFRVQIARTDGQQELKAVNVTLPRA